MPLEVCQISNNDDEDPRYELVERGEAILIADNSDGEEKVIAIECTNEITNYVYTLPRSGVLAQVREDDTLDKQEFPEPIAKVAVWEGNPHEQVIESPAGETSLIVVHQVPPDQITRTLLIPYGLRHHN